MIISFLILIIMLNRQAERAGMIGFGLLAPPGSDN